MKYVLIFGCDDGWYDSAYGPFDSEEAAFAYADKHALWPALVSPLHEPEEA